MKDIKNKRLVLFIMEIILLQKRFITAMFIEEINDFIYNYYEDNKELFALLFDTKLLEELIKNRYQVLPEKILMGLINKYHGFEGYNKLVEEVGYEIDQQINILVIKFLEYYDELINLENASPLTIYHRILQ